MNKTVLNRALIDQWRLFHDREMGLERSVLSGLGDTLEVEHVLDISGMRRVGKTTLLRQIAEKYYEPDDYYTINFDDDRLMDIEASDFQLIYEILLEEFGPRKVFFLDEIQNVYQWEQFVRRFMDQGFKVILTGSNSRLLNRELGTKLTGRHLSRPLFPFSFEECLRFYNEPPYDSGKRLTTEETARYLRFFKRFLQYGGMPLYLKYENRELLKSVYEDVVFRDVVARHGVSKVDPLKRLSYFLVSNIAGMFSPSKLLVPTGVKSTDTLRQYMEHFREAWLLFTVPIYAESVKKQQVNPKKIYCVDTGIVESVAFKFIEKQGCYLENAVYVELLRRGYELYYYKTEQNREVDFLARRKNRHQLLIQVCYDLSDPETRRRELRALKEASSETKVERCVLVTMNTEEEYREENFEVEIIPAWKWFLLKER
jgi:hypothetical protein